MIASIKNIGRLSIKYLVVWVVLFGYASSGHHNAAGSLLLTVVTFTVLEWTFKFISCKWTEIPLPHELASKCSDLALWLIQAYAVLVVIMIAFDHVYLVRS